MGDRRMSRKLYSPDQIIVMLREAVVTLARRHTVGQVCWSLGHCGTDFLSLALGVGDLKVKQAN